MTHAAANPRLPALGIRQPWAELILRGVKTIEVRSRNTRVRGPIYIYAAKKRAVGPAVVAAVKKHGVDIESLPRGVVVGTVEIQEAGPIRPLDAAAACLPPDLVADKFGWHLTAPRRLAKPLTVDYLPCGVWFYPWKRRTG